MSHFSSKHEYERLNTWKQEGIYIKKKKKSQKEQRKEKMNDVYWQFYLRQPLTPRWLWQDFVSHSFYWEVWREVRLWPWQRELEASGTSIQAGCQKKLKLLISHHLVLRVMFVNAVWNWKLQTKSTYFPFICRAALISQPLCLYLVDSAQRDPTATTYFAGPQPMYVKATGSGLLTLSK